MEVVHWLVLGGAKKRKRGKKKSNLVLLIKQRNKAGDGLWEVISSFISV